MRLRRTIEDGRERRAWRAMAPVDDAAGPDIDISRLRRRIIATHVAIVVVGAIATVAPLLDDQLRTAVFAPRVRPVIEVAGACIVLFAALILAIPSDSDVRPARNAFAAALVVLGVSNCVFGLLPAFEQSTVVGELAFYPWIAARYVVIAFFVLAGLERPRALLGSYLVLGLGVLAVVELLVLASGGLVTTLQPSAHLESTVVVLRPAIHVGLQAPPVILFAVGAWLAARLYLRGRSPEFAWLSSALAVQVVAQVHEILFPAFLGPILRSPDVLRFISFALLSGAAFVQMFRISRSLSHDPPAAARSAVPASDQRAAACLRGAGGGLSSRRDPRACDSDRDDPHVRPRRPPARASARRPRAAKCALEGITSEANSLQQLARRMEELRRLEVAEFACDLRPVPIQRVLEDLTPFVQGLPGAHQASVTADAARVLADPVRLGQALRNVLVNAGRYSPPGSTIVVEGVRVEPDRYRITVDDTGPGIPKYERRKVLRRYARGSTVSPAPSCRTARRSSRRSQRRSTTSRCCSCCRSCSRSAASAPRSDGSNRRRCGC